MIARRFTLAVAAIVVAAGTIAGAQNFMRRGRAHCLVHQSSEPSSI